MIGHDHMHHVVGAALRHVAGDAIGPGCVRAGPRERCGVALFANRIVVRGRHWPMRDVMRIVAGGAAQLARALNKALRLAQAVGAARDLKAVRRCFGLSSALVEFHMEIAQRLAGNVREWRSVEPADGVRKILASGLEVALHTYLELPVGREALRVDDGGPNLIPCHSGGSEGDVALAGPMTALAVDAFGNRIDGGHFRAGGMFKRGRNPGVSVVAEYALVVHGADGSGKIRLIVD